MMWMKPFVDFAHVIYLTSVSASAFMELLQSQTEAIFSFVAGWKAVSEKGLSIYFSLALPLTVLRSPLFVPAACAGISIASLRHIPAVHEQYREGNLDVIRIFGLTVPEGPISERASHVSISRFLHAIRNSGFCCTLNENFT